MQEQAWDGKWMTLSEAASVLGVSVITLRRSLKRGLLDGHQVITKHGPTWLVWIERAPENAPTASPQADDAVVHELVQKTARLEAANRVMLAEIGRLLSQLGDVQERLGALEARQYRHPGSSQS